MPLVLLALAVAGSLSAGNAVLETVWQVVGALVVGVLAGVTAAKALHLAQRHKATEDGPSLLYTVLLALLTASDHAPGRAPPTLYRCRVSRRRRRSSRSPGWRGP